MIILLTGIITFIIGYITNNLISKLKHREKINAEKLQAYKDLLRTWVVTRNLIVGFTLAKKTEEGRNKIWQTRAKFDEAFIGSWAHTAEICLYCSEIELIEEIIKINKNLYKDYDWFNLDLDDAEINTNLDNSTKNIFDLFSKPRIELERSSTFTWSDIQSLFFKPSFQ